MKTKLTKKIYTIMILLICISCLIRNIDNFNVHITELNIPQDALSFSVYDINQNKYLYYEGESQSPTVASLAKLFVIDYALTKVKLDEIIEVNQEVLNLVPRGSSLAHLKVGKYTAKQIIEGMLVPSGNDAAYAIAYHIGKKSLGPNQTAKEYISSFMQQVDAHLKKEGYHKTHLYDDPSGASILADSHLDDLCHITLKLLEYDFIKECTSQSHFSIQTENGTLSWKNTNAFLDIHSPYYHPNVKGFKTGTMASSYNLIVLYENNDKEYLITCLGARSNEGRYRAIQAAIQSIIEQEKR